MAGIAAVGVHDDLAAGQAAVALRAADDEAAGRVDQILDVALDQFLRQHRLDDLFDGGFAQVFQADVRRMLGRQHDGVDGVRLAIDVADGDLRLGIGARPRQAAVLAQHGLALDETVRQVDRQRHQRRRFVAGVAEHQALVAGTLAEVVVVGGIDALGDIRALLVVGDEHSAALVVDAVFGIVVADALDGVAGDLDVIDVGGRGDFAGQNDQAGVAQGFGSDAGMLVLSQDGVEDGVGNLVGNLVGMAFADRFRGEEVIAHECSSGPLILRYLPWTTSGRRFSRICESPRKLSV